MTITWATLFVLAQSCAPLIHFETLSAVVDVESGANTWAIHDNTTKTSYSPISKEAAIQLAKALHAKKHSLDLGLSQINTLHLRRLSISIEDLFDGCKNLKASQSVLNGAYQRALAAGFPYGQPALQAALSAYNTGSFYAGRAYVAKVLRAAKSPYPLQPFLKA